MAEMLLQSHTGYIAPLPALPDAWKDGQVSGLVARGNFEVSMKWKDKNLQSLSFLSNVGGDLIVDYPNIEASQIKVNGKAVKATVLKDGRIQLATQKGDVITFEHFPGRVTSLTVVRQNGVTAELTFNQVEGATHYVIQRQVKDETGQASATREFVTNQTNFIDRSLDPQLAYTYTVKAMLGELATQVSKQATVETYSKLMDDRDSRIQYGAAFGNWADSELFGGTEKFADLSKGDYTDEDITATIPFNGVGIEIYGLKSSELGLATAKIDGKEIGELDFHTAGATEKGSLIGRFTGLSDGPHTLTLSVKREHKGRGSERSKISLDYFKILAGTGNTIEKMDDRDSRIQYGSQFKDWSDPELYGGTEKYADINNSDSSAASEGQATISFTGTGIRIYGLKSLALGRARVTLDGKEMTSLDFYTSGATEKRAFIGEFTNLTDGPHTLTLQVDPDSPEGRKKISLDSFDIIKAPAVGLDSPSIAPLKENDKTISLTQPSGDWEAIAVTFPGVKDPLVLRKVDETHLVTSGDQTILSLQDNQVQIPIPDETDRKAGNVIEAYAIQGTTTSSPVVAVFTKKDEKKVDEKRPTTSKGDEPAPTVEIPEYTEPIGTAGQEEAPIVEKPEYTDPIGTSGDQAAPTLTRPEYQLRTLKDKKTGVEIIGGATDLEDVAHLASRRVLAQELFGKTYDAYDFQLKNKENHNVQLQNQVLVRLPVSGEVQGVYYLTPTRELEPQDFTIRDGMLEFLTNNVSTYAVVYNTTSSPTVEVVNPHEKPTTTETEALVHTTDSVHQEKLPATGEERNPLLFLAGLSLVLTATFLVKTKKE